MFTPLHPLADENECAASAIPESNEFCFTCFVVIFAVLESALSLVPSGPSWGPGDVMEKLLPSFSTFLSSPDDDWK